MKTIKLFTILALMLLTSVTANAQNSLVGDVNKDGRVDVSDAVMVVDIILHGQKELSLSVTEISLDKGNNVTIVITSGYGSYTVSSTDTNIADATLSGSTVIITGKNGGTTVVKVIDTISGNMQEISVTVKDDTPISYLTCPDGNHPHMIDLGLPSGTKWACCNEGASTPEEYGGYYTFGQVSSAPTEGQIKELRDKCSYQWTTQNGVRGGKFTGPNGGSIFLPAAGYRWDGELLGVGADGYYWSFTPYEEFDACFLQFNSGNAYWGIWDNGRRYLEISVRPVCKN